jgi:glycosyltransferase involved in cell wall biosynthesis
VTRTIYAFGETRLERLTDAVADDYRVVYQRDVVEDRPFRGIPVAAQVTLAVWTYRMLRREDPVVVADRFQPFRLVVLALCRLAGRPYLARTRGSAWGEFRDRRSADGLVSRTLGAALQEAVRNVVLRRADRILAVSYFNRAQLVSELDLDPARIDVVHEPCDVAAFETATPGKFRTERDLPADAGLLLAVTNFDYREKARGLEYFLPAIQRVLRERPDWRFVVAGAGTHRRRVERAVRRRCDPDVRDRVSFLGHYAPIASALVDADVLVHPSFRDALPNAVIEAQASRTPVVTNPEGSAMGESLPDEYRAAQLAADRDPFARRLSAFASDPALRATVGEHNHAVAVDRYAPDPVAETFAAVIEGVDTPRA